ncbi:MAG: ankyrin repeat domain-containing protein [Candidatus Margulisiibacteriota bacterium]
MSNISVFCKISDQSEVQRAKNSPKDSICDKRIVLSQNGDKRPISKSDSNAFIKSGAQLISAASEGNVQLVKDLLSRGADIKAVDTEGGNALFHAAANGNVEIVKALIAAGVFVNAYSLSGSTPLKRACSFGNLDVVRELLKAGAAVNFSGVATQSTALHCAVVSGKKEIVEELIDAGADIEAGSDISTALAEAASRGNIEITRTLLKFGANPTPRYDSYIHSKQPLFEAIFNRDAESVKLLVTSGAYVDLDICRRGDIVENWTPLMCAVEMGSTDIAKFLIESGADTGKKDWLGRTAHDIAAERKDEKMLRVLSETHALPGAKGKMRSVQNVCRNADVNSKDIYGRTVIMDLTEKPSGPYTERVAALLSKGADINASDNRGWTALTYAAKNGDMETAAFLIVNGADPNVKTRHGRTLSEISLNANRDIGVHVYGHESVNDHSGNFDYRNTVDFRGNERKKCADLFRSLEGKPNEEIVKELHELSKKAENISLQNLLK